MFWRDEGVKSENGGERKVYWNKINLTSNKAKVDNAKDPKQCFDKKGRRYSGI